MTKDEARKIADGIAKLPELLKRPQDLPTPVRANLNDTTRANSC